MFQSLFIFDRDFHQLSVSCDGVGTFVLVIVLLYFIENILYEIFPT